MLALCVSDPNEVQPTEVEAKFQIRFNGDSWLCLDTIRPPILFSVYAIPLPFEETPSPKSDTLQQTGTSGKSLRLELGKDVIHVLCFVSPRVCRILSRKIFFHEWRAY